jgi:hypothetical protein
VRGLPPRNSSEALNRLPGEDNEALERRLRRIDIALAVAASVLSLTALSRSIFGVRPLYAHWHATATTRVRKKLRRGDLGPPEPGFLSPLESTDWPAASTVPGSNRSGVTRPRDPGRRPRATGGCADAPHKETPLVTSRGERRFAMRQLREARSGIQPAAEWFDCRGTGLSAF